MGVVTSRLCGTCRFFETVSSGAQGHCRNPAYPRRDELAMLRASELGCREGWDLDFWAPAGVQTPAAAVPPENPATLAVPAAPELGRAEPPVVAPRSADDFAARFSPLVPPTVSSNEDLIIGQDGPSLQHPELNDQGVPLPRPRRSAVMEAHRRAVERRNIERQALDQKGPPARAVPRPVPQAVQQAPVANSEAKGPVQVTPPAVSNTPAAAPVRSRQNSSLAGLPAAIGATPAPRASGPSPADRPLADVERPGPSLSGRSTPPGKEPAASELRYWDAPPSGSRFVRMRPAAANDLAVPPAAPKGVTLPEPVPDVRQVGRARQAPVRGEPPERTIRTLERRTDAAPRPGTAGESRDRPAGPPEVAPEVPVQQPRRHADPSVVQRLAVEWRQQAVQSQVGRRCGNCRYFRGGEGTQGQCEAVGAPTYRHVVTAPDLACLSPVGVWWAGNDTGWLEKTYMPRPGRSTPLLDALLREMGNREPVLLERRARGR